MGPSEFWNFLWLCLGEGREQIPSPFKQGVPGVAESRTVVFWRLSAKGGLARAD